MWLSEFSDPDGLIAGPDGTKPTAAVLVLSGSSGRVERERVLLLAKYGLVAMSLRWFGGAGQAPGICEIPLEVFTPALERLSQYCGHVAVLGSSKGAEAALLLATREPAIDVVIALSPSSVVWANVGPGTDGVEDAVRSSWTVAGSPLPFVPYDDNWEPSTSSDGPIFRGLYEQSLVTFADKVSVATIPVERIVGSVVVSGGGDDWVWPSDRFAQEIADRRSTHGLATTVVTSVIAGHRVLLPGEEPAVGGQSMARGGSRFADGELGNRVWAAMREVLLIREHP